MKEDYKKKLSCQLINMEGVESGGRLGSWVVNVG